MSGKFIGAPVVVNEAVDLIRRYWEGIETPIKFRYSHLNNNLLGGLYKGNILVIGGISGTGKSFVLKNLEEDIFDKKLNPGSDNYMLIRCNWEMSGFKLLVRSIKNHLKIKTEDLLFNKDKLDLTKLGEVANFERNPNIYYYPHPTYAEEWYKDMYSFLSEHRDKKHIVITIDHIALVKTKGDKKLQMDLLINYANSLRQEYPNVSFIILSQLNRDIETRENVKNLAPKRSDLYQSDTMFHIADVVLILHNPYRLGHDKYMRVPVKRYEYLKEYMLSPDNKYSSFKTEGLIFWHYLKLRELDDLKDLKDLHIEVVYKTDESQKTSENYFDDDMDMPF